MMKFSKKDRIEEAFQATRAEMKRRGVDRVRVDVQADDTVVVSFENGNQGPADLALAFGIAGLQMD